MLSPLIGALFLSTRAVVILGVVNLCGLTVLPLVAPHALPTLVPLVGTVMTNGITTVLALLYIHYRDQLEEKRREQIKQSEERLRTALEGAGAGHFEFNPRTGEIQASPRALQLLGLAPDEWGGHVDDLMRRVHPDDRESVGASIAQALEPGATFEYEHRIVRPDGEVRWTEIRGRHLREAGRSRIVGTVTDVTGRRLLEQQLRQAQKMEAVGRLAGGVAHDFNNLLTVVLGNLHLLRERVKAEELDMIEDAAVSARSLTAELLAFSRQSELRFEVVDLGEVVGSVMRMVERIIGEDIRISFERDREIWPTKADPIQIQQALLNLASNSRDAMPQGGELSFEVRNSPRRPGVGRQASRDFVVVSVRDTGTGMSPETREHIFEPFYTTKPRGQGTGLGLAMVFSMMEQSSGYVRVDSEPQRGARFDLFFPRVEPVAGIVAQESRPSRVGQESILLIEDETMVRKLCKSVLGSAGYDVKVAKSAEEALEVWKRCGGAVDLLVSDVVMPGRTGLELAQDLLQERPDLAVIFMSGYAPPVAVDLGDAVMDFIAKPFGGDDLLRKVRDVLDRNEAVKSKVDTTAVSAADR